MLVLKIFNLLQRLLSAKKTLDQVADGIFSVPEGFKILRKVQKLFDSSQNMLRNGQLDWALGELLAYGSLLAEGHDVRLSGQDVRRGTFSHRHSVIRDEESDELHNRLNAIQNRKGEFRIFNSLLSEFGVLGFEFGYSMASPDPLVIWEAQFGDFSNGAQTIIDQFISSSLSKWQRMSGLVMLLPHGYEGQGPEPLLPVWSASCSSVQSIISSCQHHHTCQLFPLASPATEVGFPSPAHTYEP